MPTSTGGAERPITRCDPAQSACVITDAIWGRCSNKKCRLPLRCSKLRLGHEGTLIHVCLSAARDRLLSSGPGRAAPESDILAWQPSNARPAIDRGPVLGEARLVLQWLRNARNSLRPRINTLLHSGSSTSRDFLWHWRPSAGSACFPILHPGD